MIYIPSNYELKIYYIDPKTGKESTDKNLHPNYDPKVLNTYAKIIINDLLPKYNRIDIMPLGAVRYRFFRAMLVKYLDQKEWDIKTNVADAISLRKKDNKVINEVATDLSSAYDWKYVGGSDNKYTFTTGKTDYKTVFIKEDEGMYERIYAPINKDMEGTETKEGKAIPINATVMAITLDFLEKNKDWYMLTIHPIDPKRYRLVMHFIDNTLPDKYAVEEIEGVINITRKQRLDEKDITHTVKKKAENIKEANIVQVPEEILTKLEGVYDYIVKHKDELHAKAHATFVYPWIPPEYNKYLKFNDLSGKPIEVSIGFYNNPKDTGTGRMDTRTDVMLVNLAFFGDKEDFLDLGEHELVHAMDPKVRDVKIFGKMYPKKGAEPDQNIDKYLKSPWEFDAFTAPLINKLKANLNKYGDKQKYTQELLQLFSDLKTKDALELIDDEKYDSLVNFFTTKNPTEENYPQMRHEFYTDLIKIKAWTTKPALYKKFLQRLYTSIK